MLIKNSINSCSSFQQSWVWFILARAEVRGRKQKSDRKAIFIILTQQRYTTGLETIHLLSTHITGCTALIKDVQNISGTYILACWMRPLIIKCAIKQYIWFTLISSRKTAKTFHVHTHTCLQNICLLSHTNHQSDMSH